VNVEGGLCPPRLYHSHHGGGDSVTLADLLKVNKPQIPLAIIGTGCTQNAIRFQIDHKGVNSALMAAGVKTKRAHKVAAGQGSVVDQAGADGGADDGFDHQSDGVARGPFASLECILEGQALTGAGLSQSEIMLTCSKNCIHSSSLRVVQFFSTSSAILSAGSLYRRREG